jgi:hypothetical protein
MKSITFWDKTPCSPLNVNRRFGGKYCLYFKAEGSAFNLFSMLISYLSYSSALNMEAIVSSETSGYFQRTTWRYIPEDNTLYKNRAPFDFYVLNLKICCRVSFRI